MKDVMQDLTKVGVVSTDPLRVVGLQAILEAEPEAAEYDCTGAYGLAPTARFRVVPLSLPSALQTPGLSLVLIDGGATEYLFHLIAGFRRDRPKLRLIVLAAESDEAFIEQVIAAGARGYLSYTASEREIKQAIEAVDAGSVWASREVLASLLDRPQDMPYPAMREPPRFTRREREVLRLLAQGFPNREIGHALGVDEGTVKAHVGRLMRKVGVVNRTALAMLSLERKLC